MTNRLAILGSTGSIGVNTLEVVRRHSEKFDVVALAANRNVKLMLQQCRVLQPANIVMTDSEAAQILQQRLNAEGIETKVIADPDGLNEIAGDCSELAADTVVCGIVGAVGLASTIAAVAAGKKVLVANKEPLVMLGNHIMTLARQSGATILPLDSEHNAIFQCLPGHRQQLSGKRGDLPEAGVRKLILTGSGGPFRDIALADFDSITPEQACAHPNWDMGKKISVDSASMMNKGLELIEACVLFGMDESDVEIVIHPQSVVHSMVEYEDGSVLAQMGNPDMKIPIANALAWPDRITSGASSLDIISSGRFDFMAPDAIRFPALKLARIAARTGGVMPAVMNASNEVAVQAFLEQRISFRRITELVEETVDKVADSRPVNFENAMDADREARAVCNELLPR